MVPEPVAAGTVNDWANLVAFSDVARRHHAPRFEQYPAAAPFRGRSAPVDLTSYPGARRYRTVLREGAREGPNLAGRFTLVHWGCGSPCIQIAIIDAPTGRIVYMTPDSEALVTAPMFRLDSRLVVEDPTKFTADTAGHPTFSGVEFYEWTGADLVLRDSLNAGALRVPLDSVPWICCSKPARSSRSH